MTHKIILTANARRDIQQAIDWEDERADGLGRRVFEDIGSRLRDIALFPAFGTVRYDQVRCAATKTFPYLIHYLIDAERPRVFILRVLHTSRKPGG